MFREGTTPLKVVIIFFQEGGENAKNGKFVKKYVGGTKPEAFFNNVVLDISNAAGMVRRMVLVFMMTGIK